MSESEFIAQGEITQGERETGAGGRDKGAGDDLEPLKGGI